MAGRIPQTFIDDIIDRSDILEVVSSRVQLKKSGKNYAGCCPFHDEKTPSFTVSPQKQFYYCFGCGAGGNVIGFIMEYDRLDFPSAVELLAKSAGLEVPREESRPGAEARQQRMQDIYSELERAAGFYRSQLREHQPAIEYLKSRGLTGEIARTFAIGYAPDRWDGLTNFCAGDDEALHLQAEGGMLKRDEEDRYYDLFRDRIMFPIRDQRGRIIAFGGRVMGDQKPKYLNSPETPVFRKSRELYGLHEALQQRHRPTELIVVEGYMDVISLAQFGVTNAVATLGTSVGSAHMERIFRHVGTVGFCFDGDAAGRRAAERALDACLPAMLDGREARFLFLPEGEDPDTIVRSEGEKGFRERFTQAKPLSEFVFDLASEGLDLSVPDQRAIFAHQALPYLNRLPRGLLHSVLITRLAEETGIGESQLTDISAKAAPAPRMGVREPLPPEADVDPAAEDIERSPDTGAAEPQPMPKHFRRLLGFILQSPALVLRDELDQEFLAQSDYQGTLSEIAAMVAENPDAKFINLHAYWISQAPDTARETANIYGARLLKELSEEKLEADFCETVAHMKQQQTRSAVEQRMREIGAIPYDRLTPAQRQEQRELHTRLKQQ